MLQQSEVLLCRDFQVLLINSLGQQFRPAVWLAGWYAIQDWWYHAIYLCCLLQSSNMQILNWRRLL